MRNMVEHEISQNSYKKRKKRVKERLLRPSEVYFAVAGPGSCVPAEVWVEPRVIFRVSLCGLNKRAQEALSQCKPTLRTIRLRN